MSNEQDEIKKRSEQMVELFKAMKGRGAQEFPVPPFTKWLNGTIMNVKRGEMEFEFVVRPEMANPTGLLHGGMQCALMDDTIGVTCATLGYEGFLISIDFHVDYLGKVKVGEKVRVKGQIVREGRKIVHAMAEIHDIEGNLIATGSSNLTKTSFRPDYRSSL
ncbi:MAG: PaaI family thioesterase [Candidatus Freyarchaeum deiterrae]